MHEDGPTEAHPLVVESRAQDLKDVDIEIASSSAAASAEVPEPKFRATLAATIMLVLAAAVVVAGVASHKTSVRTRYTGVEEYAIPTVKNTCTEPASGPVLKGYDLVAYFSLDESDEAVQGDPNIKTLWGEEGAQQYEFHFSTTKNRDLFIAEPEKYLPAYGGFCSWGVSGEDMWTTYNLGPKSDPDVWKIINGRLYLFMYILPQQYFMDSDKLVANIANADRRWDAWTAESGMMFNTYCYWHEELKGGDLLEER
jgi:hypothetical protein